MSWSLVLIALNSLGSNSSMNVGLAEVHLKSSQNTAHFYNNNIYLNSAQIVFVKEKTEQRPKRTIFRHSVIAKPGK